MKLTNEDRLQIDKLIRSENLYHRMRYANFVLGLICFIIAFGGFGYLLSVSREAAMQFGSHPMIYLLGISGGLGIGMGYRGWKGKPETKLLLSLAEKVDAEE